MDLKNKVGVVTGASSGLGKAVTEQLHREGVKVFALARTIADTTFSDGVVKIQCDIRETKSIHDAFVLLDQQTNKIDFLVNCAGRGLVKELEKTSTDEIHEVIEVNLVGNIIVSQEVYTRMLPQTSGHIINVISTSGAKARIDEPIYVASKWGLRGFTESLRMAAAKHKIRVTAVLPGGMNTPFWSHGEARDTATYMNPADVASEIVHLLQTAHSLSPAEYIIERGFA